MDNEKLQEISIVVGDRIRSAGKAWWYALLISILACIPLYYILRSVFAEQIVRNHKFPAFIYQVPVNQPLEITQTQIFKYSDNTYSGFVKIKNPNLEYGSNDQTYSASFVSLGGTELKSFNGTAFILPSSEKIIVFPRFAADKQPAVLNVQLASTNFIHIPSIAAPNLEIQRVVMQQQDNQFVVSAAIKNKSPFTISQVGLPVLLYDAANKIVGANFTNINQLQNLETRTFQFTWPSNPNAVRAEILPEANIFDPNIYSLPPGQSQFDTQTTNP